MSYQFEAGSIYRMPTHFGLRLGLGMKFMRGGSKSKPKPANHKN